MRRFGSGNTCCEYREDTRLPIIIIFTLLHITHSLRSHLFLDKPVKPLCAARRVFVK